MLAGAPAFSGTLTSPPVAAVSVTAPDAGVDWSGAYIGGVYATASGDNAYNYFDGPVAFYAIEGNAFGGFAGYRHDIGAFVLGGEATYLFANDLHEIDQIPEYSYNSLLDLKATVGYDLGRALLYVEGGYSVASFYTEAADKNTMNDWLFGAGVDYKLGERYFIGAEYIYRDLRNTEFWDVNDGLSGQISALQVRAGMSF